MKRRNGWDSQTPLGRCLGCPPGIPIVPNKSDRQQIERLYFHSYPHGQSLQGSSIGCIWISAHPGGPFRTSRNAASTMLTTSMNDSARTKQFHSLTDTDRWKQPIISGTQDGRGFAEFHVSIRRTKHKLWIGWFPPSGKMGTESAAGRFGVETAEQPKHELIESTCVTVGRYSYAGLDTVPSRRSSSRAGGARGRVTS